MSTGTISRLATLICFTALPAHAGYTHYFTWHQQPDTAALAACVDEMRQILEARRSLVAGPEGEGPPWVANLTLQFNGVAEDSHEPFVFPGDTSSIPKGPNIPAGFNFCKTGGEPYDEVVTACLLVARDHFPAKVLTIHSDGSWAGGDWRAGAKLYTSVVHREARNPLDRDEPRKTDPDPDAVENTNYASYSETTYIFVLLSVFVCGYVLKKILT